MDCDGDDDNDPPPPHCAPPPPPDDDGAASNIFLWIVTFLALVAALMNRDQINAFSNNITDTNTNSLSRKLVYTCPTENPEPISRSICGILSKSDENFSEERKKKVCPLLRQLEYAESTCTEYNGFDLALCTNGATVLSTLETRIYPEDCGNDCFKRVDNILNKELSVGASWSFCGHGYVLIKILMPATIVGFAIHHPENNTIPDGYAVSAPKEFGVYGLMENDQEFYFGTFEYSLQGKGSQYFAVRKFTPNRYTNILFAFGENHGNPVYTAVYRVSIFGETGKPWFEA